MCSWVVFGITTCFLLHELPSEPHLLAVLSNSFLLLSNIAFRPVILLRWFILILKLLLDHHVFNVLLLIYIHFILLLRLVLRYVLMILRSRPILRMIWLILHIIATLRTYSSRFLIKSLIDTFSSAYQCVGWRKLIKLHF